MPEPTDSQALETYKLLTERRNLLALAIDDVPTRRLDTLALHGEASAKAGEANAARKGQLTELLARDLGGRDGIEARLGAGFAANSRDIRESLDAMSRTGTMDLAGRRAILQAAGRHALDTQRDGESTREAKARAFGQEIRKTLGENTEAVATGQARRILDRLESVRDGADRAVGAQYLELKGKNMPEEARDERLSRIEAKLPQEQRIVTPERGTPAATGERQQDPEREAGQTQKRSRADGAPLGNAATPEPRSFRLPRAADGDEARAKRQRTGPEAGETRQKVIANPYGKPREKSALEEAISLGRFERDGSLSIGNRNFPKGSKPTDAELKREIANATAQIAKVEAHKFLHTHQNRADFPNLQPPENWPPTPKEQAGYRAELNSYYQQQPDKQGKTLNLSPDELKDFLRSRGLEAAVEERKTLQEVWGAEASLTRNRAGGWEISGVDYGSDSDSRERASPGQGRTSEAPGNHASYDSNVAERGRDGRESPGLGL